MNLLTNVSVAFLTPNNTNDKDANTAITLTLFDSNRNQLAISSGFANNVRFIDNGTVSGTFYIPVTNPIDKASLAHGSFDIQITPVGNDTWVFQPQLTLTFQDGSAKSPGAYSPRVCDQDGQTSTFIF